MLLSLPDLAVKVGYKSVKVCKDQCADKKRGSIGASLLTDKTEIFIGK